MSTSLRDYWIDFFLTPVHPPSPHNSHARYMTNYQEIIDRYYPAGSALRDIYLRHCGQVADLAAHINESKHLGLDPGELRSAAMLHDIGIYRCDAPSIECHGTEPYIRHGIIGAQILRDCGAPETMARVAERHTGAGLTAHEIEQSRLPLPAKDYLPETTLERLICYADKFYSKSSILSSRPKPIDKVRKQMARFGEESLSRFIALDAEFGPVDT